MCVILEAIYVLTWRNSTPRFVFTPKRRNENINENINVNKYLISSSGDQTHNQSILQSHFVPLRHHWPQVKWDNSMKHNFPFLGP